MNYSVLSRFQWIHVDANILEKMPRKTEKFVLVRVDKVIFKLRVFISYFHLMNNRNHVFCMQLKQGSYRLIKFIKM